MRFAAFLIRIFFVLNVNGQKAPKIYFERDVLKKEVNIYLNDLKKNQPETEAIAVDTYIENDIVFISLENSYPGIAKIKAYTKYRGIDFCFGQYSVKGSYRVIHPMPTPKKFKIINEEIKKGKRLMAYEP